VLLVAVTQEIQLAVLDIVDMPTQAAEAVALLAALLVEPEALAVQES
jgi:hypothetical protein